MEQAATTLQLTLRNEPTATRRLREAVDEVAGTSRLDAEARFDLKLAATEALTNALRGAPDEYAVEVAVTGSEGTVDVEVTDRGCFLPRAMGTDDRGRGRPRDPAHARARRRGRVRLAGRRHAGAGAQAHLP